MKLSELFGALASDLDRDFGRGHDILSKLLGVLRAEHRALDAAGETTSTDALPNQSLASAPAAIVVPLVAPVALTTYPISGIDRILIGNRDGNDNHPANSDRQWSYDFYTRGVTGQDVHAVAGGQVIMVRDDLTDDFNESFGNSITIKVSDTLYVTYSNLLPNSATVSEGQIITEGTVIALSGESGVAGEGPQLHIHFGSSTTIANLHKGDAGTAEIIADGADDDAAPAYFPELTIRYGSSPTDDAYVGTFGIDDFTGNALANNVEGLEGNDILRGDDGDDTLNGGVGADTLAGGAGNDILVVDDPGDVVSEKAGQGIDTVRSTITYALTANVENLHLEGDLQIDGTGNVLDNAIDGNSARNAIDGGGGDDTLDGGAAADSLTGGAGNDLFIVDNSGDVVVEMPGGGIDTIQSFVSYKAPSGVENLTLLGTAPINAAGNSLDNVLTGNLSNNTLNGKGGADTMIGGAGNDTYAVDDAGDVVIEAANGGIDLVQTNLSTYTLSDNVENLTFVGNASVVGTGNAMANEINGSTGNDSLIGQDSNDTLKGGDGNDTLNGGAGTDVLIGGMGNDRYIVQTATDSTIEAAGGGLDTVVASLTWTLGAQIENLTLSGASVINGTGNSLDNSIIGNTAANVIDGSGGDDTIDGGLGADTITGGNGLDIFRFTTALGGGNIDKINDFSVVNDTIQLDDAVFTTLAPGTLTAAAFHIGTAAADASDRIIYNSATGALFYDADGVGGVAAVQFATLTAGLALTINDFFVI